jgi:hypothetical protein
VDVQLDDTSSVRACSSEASQVSDRAQDSEISNATSDVEGSLATCRNVGMNVKSVVTSESNAAREVEIQQGYFRTISRLMNGLAVLLAFTAVLNGITELPRPAWFIANTIAFGALAQLALLPMAYRMGYYSQGGITVPASARISRSRGYERIEKNEGIASTTTGATAAHILHRFEADRGLSLSDNTKSQCEFIYIYNFFV